VPGFTTSGVSSIPIITDDEEKLLPPLSLPSTGSSVQQHDSRSWHGLDTNYSSNAASGILESTLAVGQYSPANVVALSPSADQSRWTQALALLPIEVPMDEFSTSETQSAIADHKPRRTRRQMKPILAGPNKYGRSGKQRCLTCRNRKQKAYRHMSETYFSASTRHLSPRANFALSEKLSATKFGDQNDNKTLVNRTSSPMLHWIYLRWIYLRCSESRNNRMISV
jgi:hypothetical protein